MTHTYDVVLDGQLGQRFGQLRWKENGSSVEGMFFLLGVQNPIRGRREGNTLVLTHELKTAVSTLSSQTPPSLCAIIFLQTRLRTISRRICSPSIRRFRPVCSMQM